MLEGKLIELLKNCLEPYVDGIDSNQLQWKNLLAGRVVLNNLHLKPSLVDFLELPYHLTFGFIGEIVIRVHISMLHISKTKLMIDVNDVVILCTAVPECQWDAKAYREQYLTTKIATLAAESLQLVVKEIQGGGFFWKTMVSFLESWEIVLSNFHLRIEDYTTNPDVSYAIGCVIKKAVFHTDNERAHFRKQGSAQDTIPLHQAFYNDNGTLNSSVLSRNIDLEGVGFYIDQLDPIRLGFFNQNEGSDIKKTTSRSSTVTATSLDPTTFVDAIGETTLDKDEKTTKQIRHAQYISVLPTDINRRPIYMFGAVKKKLSLSKSKRGFYNGRGKVRCKRDIRDKYGLLFEGYNQHIPGNSTRVSRNVIGRDNLFCTNVISHLIQYLVQDGGCVYCRGTKVKWQRDQVRNAIKSKRNKQHDDVMETHLRKLISRNRRLRLGVKDAKKYRNVRMTLGEKVKRRRESESSDNLRIHMGSLYDDVVSRGLSEAGQSAMTNIRRAATSLRGDSDITITSINSNRSDMFDCDISSYSSWRILLSTFCKIVKRPYLVDDESKTCDMLLEAQMRKKHGTCRPQVITSGQNTRDSLSDSSQSGTTIERADFLGVCSDSNHVLDDDIMPGQEPIEIPDALSYDMFWHAKAKTAIVTKVVHVETPTLEIENVQPKEPPPKGVKFQNYAWTRYNFVVDSNENPQLKELFLLGLLELDHNYILNPKDFKGAANFYFCGFPTVTKRKPKSSWSAWGELHNKSRLNAYNDGAYCLPKCTVFVVLDDLEITFTRQQFCCVLNFVYANLLKYFNWQAGVICTFESPRATADDENLYMEYWPQYLLLDRNNKRDQLHEFIRDFEILHSYNMIRVLRNNASEALRALIKQFKDQSKTASLGSGECLTSAIFTNVCGQFDETDPPQQTSRQDNKVKLKNRLKLVGGIYELVTQRAQSESILNSLSKICPPHTLTVDIALDVALFNSKVTLLHNMDSFGVSDLSMMGNVLALDGLHFYFQDVYGRDGSQFTEIELLPFSILNVAFNMCSATRVLKKMDCGCRLMDGPATVLLSCGDASKCANKSANELKKQWGLRRLLERTHKQPDTDADMDEMRFLLQSHRRKQQTSDSVLYFSVEFSHFCTPEDADIRLLFHLNSELFLHLCILDELKHIHRMFKYDLEHFGKFITEYVDGQRMRKYNCEAQQNGNITQVYELIDLGVDYYNNLIKGEMDLYNLDLVVECGHQIVLMLQTGDREFSDLYFIVLDSIAVTSQVNPKKDPETNVYSHLVRLSNIQCHASGADFTFIKRPERIIYTGFNSRMTLADYINNINVVDEEDDENDNVVDATCAADYLTRYKNRQQFLNSFKKTSTLFTIGKEADVCIKLSYGNEVSEESISFPSYALVVNMGTVYFDIRDIDVLLLLNLYLECFQLKQEFDEMVNTMNKDKDVGYAWLDHAKRDGAPSSFDTPNLYAEENFNSLVTKKWLDLQYKAQDGLRTSRFNLKYEMKLDFLNFTLERSVPLEYVKNNCSPVDANNVVDPPLVVRRNPIIEIPSEESLESMPGVTTDSPNRPRMFKRLTKLISRSSHHSTKTALPKNQSSKNEEQKPKPKPKATVTKRRPNYVDTLDGVRAMLRQTFSCIPLCSTKITGVGLRIVMGDYRVNKCRAFVGCVEIEDQSNTVPLYLSCLVKGGNSISAWRWLKVKREYNMIISLLNRFNTQNSRMSARQRMCSTSRLKPRELDAHFKHIDIDTIPHDLILDNEYNERYPFDFRPGVVVDDFFWIQRYLDRLMDLDTTSFGEVIDVAKAHQTKTNPCFITFSIDVVDYQMRAHVHINSTVINVVWEFLDELSHYAMRMASKLHPLPWIKAAPRENVQTTKKNANDGNNVHAAIHVEKSYLNILVDPCWFGYSNFIRYIWYKLLRNAFNMVEVTEKASVNESRRGSIIESADASSSIHSSSKDVLHRNPLYRGVGASDVLPTMSSVISTIKDDCNTPIILMDSSYSGTGARAKWDFVQCLVLEKFKRAYLIAPISLRITGSGAMNVTFSTLHGMYAQSNHSNWVSKVKGLLSCLVNIIPCTIGINVSGNSLCAELTRSYTGNVLTNCGVDMGILTPPSSPEIKGELFNFINFTRPQRLDEKFTGMLELSKNTIYDFSNSLGSKIIEPTRFVLDIALNLYDPHCLVGAPVPQSISITFHLEPFVVDMSVVDAMVILDFVELLKCSLNSACGYARDIVSDALHQEIYSVGLSGDRIGSQHLEMLSQKCKEYHDASLCDTSTAVLSTSDSDEYDVDEFHSCSNSTSQDEWASVSVTEKNKEASDTRAIVQDSRISSGRFLKRLLSCVNVGLKINMELLDINICSFFINDVQRKVVLSLEDWNFVLWANCLNNYGDSLDTVGSWDEEPSTRKVPKYTESSILSDIYTSTLEKKVSACTSNLLALAAQGLLTNSTDDVLFPLEPEEPLIRYESSGLITADICHDASTEMILETTRFYIRGTKPTLESQIVSNLSTSWINVNVTLNLARCIFGFLNFCLEMQKFRIGLLESSMSDCLEMQPVNTCLLSSPIRTSMIPKKMIPKDMQSVEDSQKRVLTRSLSNFANYGELASWFLYRLGNSLFGRARAINVHRILIDSVSEWVKSKSAFGTNVDAAGLIQGQAAPVPNESLLNVDNKMPQCAMLYNNLGQPIAICSNFNVESSNSVVGTWVIIKDGDSYPLPAGPYGVLMPFVMRIKLNNCIYEIPSTLFNVAQDDETMIRLDMPKKFGREMLPRKRDILRRSKRSTKYINQYRFGVGVGNVACYVDTVGLSSIHKGLYSRPRRQPGSASYYNLFHNTMNKFHKSRRGKSRRVGLFCKYAYVMVRSVSRLGFAAGAGAMPRQIINLHVSSTIWISNKSQSDVAVFPSVGFDFSSRNIPNSSLVWLGQVNPDTDTVPLSSKTIELLNEAGQIKTKGNVLFKQIANIHDSLRSIRKVPISHHLECEPADATASQFRLQYIEIPASSFKNFRVAVPLSWTIEPSCTIAVALNIDFPKEIALSPPSATFSLRGRRISSPRNLQHMSAMAATFYGDLLFTRECAQHLYNSFEHQYIETPIPGYRGQVSLGISDHAHEYEQHASMPEASISFLNATASKKDGEVPTVDPDAVVAAAPSTTTALTVINESIVPEQLLKSRSFRVTNATKAIAVYPYVRSGTGSGILIRSSGATVAINTRGIDKIDSRHWADNDDAKRKAPSVILTCTLTEVTAMSSRAMFTTSYPKENVRNYEVILESCHVVENMMPYDVHVINPTMYTRLQQGTEDLVDMDPCFIKTGNSAQFPTFMTRGRFIIKNLLSREFKIKPTGVDHSTVDLEFDAMSSEVLKNSHLLLGDVEQQQALDTDAFPSHLIVCFETRRRPIDTVHEKSGITRRYLASTQIYCTIFSENWIINWLGVPITLCKNDGRFKQVVPAQKCCLAVQNLSTAAMHLELKISNVRRIPNFDSYPKKRKPRWYKFDNIHDADIQSSSFSIPDLTYASCMFKCSHEHPTLHYLVAASMAPTPFFRTSVLEILPQVVLTNSFDFTIWIRETDSNKAGGKNAKNTHLYCQKIEPQSTIEFHSQTKGELFFQVSAIDPSLYDSMYKGKRLKSHAGSRFSIWSCPISLQPSTTVQVRYPRELIAEKEDHALAGDMHSDKSPLRPDSHRMVGYGMCEVEVQLHRGTKMVHFTASSTPDWVILNKTGIDIWVEQQGVSGFGEVCHFHSHAAVDNFQNTNSKGLQFAWYDPFKDHKLVCRFYLQSNPSGRLSGALGKSRTFWGFKQSLGKPFMNNIHLSRALSRKSRNVKIRGALVVDLRHIQSIRTSCVCNIRCGGLTLRVQLSGQTVVMQGQRTLVLTASRKQEGKIEKFGRLKSMPTADRKLVGNLIKLPKGKVPGRMMPSSRQSSNLGNKTTDGLAHGSNAQTNGPITSPSIVFVPGLYARRLKNSKPSFAVKPYSGKRFNLQHVIIANILGIGISLCSQLPEEIVYMSFTLLRYKQKFLDYENRNTLSIGWIQFDVHDANTCYPTLLRPITNIRSFSFRRDKASKMAIRRVHRSSFKVLTILYNTRQNRYCTLKEITNFSVEVSPLSLNLDTVIGANLLLLLDEYLSIFGYQELAAQHFANVRMGIFANVDLWLKSFDVVEYPLREIAKSQYSEYANAGPRYNISMLHVGRLVLLMNIRRSGTLVTTEYQPNSALIRYLIHFLRRAPHISDANIVLGQVTMLELCCAPYVLLTHFGSRYIAQAMQQVYKVLGAIDLLGNPKIILHHWVNGLVEAFFLTRDAVRHAHFPPTAIILLLQAVLRCVVAFLSGGFDAIYRATGSLHLLFYTLSRNSDRYAVLLMSEVFKRPLGQPSNLFEGLYFAIKAYSRNFYISIGNFTLKPVYALNRFVHVLRATRCKCSEVFTSGFHIIGSVFSAAASLVFGTVSSVLSGISIAAQGFLNQLNTVPMLRAIRPKRSLQLLKLSGPMRYNYLESWSVDAVKQVDTAGDVLVTLPLHHTALFDPVSKGVAHWTILCKEADAISPLVFHMRGGMISYFWIDRVKMGQVYNGKIAWCCDIKDVKSIQLFKVGYPTSTMPHQDSLYVKLGAKIARRYYGVEDDYFLRIVHCGKDNKASTGWRRRDRIPKQIFKALQDPSTFNAEQTDFMVDSAEPDAKSQVDVSIVTTPSSAESSAFVEAFNRERAKRLYGSADPLSKLEPVEQTSGWELLEVYRRGSIESVHSDRLRSKQHGRVSFNVAYQSGNHLVSTAKIIRMANLQVAKVYFSMITSVLKEATL